MTAPSLVLDRIAATLQSEIGAAFKVQTHDGQLGADGKDFVTLGAAGVLVACLGFPSMGDVDTEPRTANAHFVAFCFAKIPNVAASQDSSGDVAMDLAANVTAIVARERWDDEDGEPTAAGVSEKIRCTNEFTNALAQKGLRVWCVQWLQEIELSSAVDSATLNALAAMNLGLAVVNEADPDDDEFEDDTPDEAVLVEYA